MDDLQQDEVENFLQNNPDFVRKWQSRHSTVDVKRQSLKCTLKVPGETGYSATTSDTVLQEVKSKSRGYTSVVTENEIYREFVKDTVFEVNVDKQCHKILQNACIVLDCERASLFLLHGTAKKLHLVSKLFDVTATSVMEDTIHNEENAIRIPFGKGIVGYVAEYSCLLNIKDAYEDERFLHEIDKSTGFCTKSILSVPIKDRDGVVIGVAQALNKKHDRYFDSNDEIIFQNFLSFCGISIINERLLEISQVEFKRHKLLLKLAKFVLKEQINFRKLISEILRHAMDMLDCSKISVYLTENRMDAASPTTSSKVFQLLKDEEEVEEVLLDPKYIIPVDQNLKSINIIDIIRLQSESRETLITVEGEVGSWLLCMTITNATSEVVGCIIFVRHSKDVFDQSDINLMETFALICGISIHNCRIYERSVRMLAQRETLNQLLAYHTTCDRSLIEPFLQEEPGSSEEYHIYSYNFDESCLTDDETIHLCFRMLLEKNALILLNLPIDILYRFILTAKKNYRLNIYHNWGHAVNVMQAMFCILTTGQMQLYFTEFEQICLLIAALVHDLDHRGKNNAFHVKTSSPFATLYSSSVLEYHHIERTFMILNTTETNLFQNLSDTNYKYGLKVIEKVILATDLQAYFREREVFKEKIESGDKMFDTRESIELLMRILMTAADLSAITKPWEIQKAVAVKVAAEFYEQGDEEKGLNQEVVALMDREKRYKLPGMQVAFIDDICIPLYQLLCELQDGLMPLYEGVLQNRIHWSNINDNLEDFDIDFEMQKVYSDFALSLVFEADTISTPPSEHDKITNTSICTQTNLIFPKIKEIKEYREESSQTADFEESFQRSASIIGLLGSIIVLEKVKETPSPKLLSVEVDKCKDTKSKGIQTIVLRRSQTARYERRYGYVSSNKVPTYSTAWGVASLELSDFILPTKPSPVKSKSVGPELESCIRKSRQTFSIYECQGQAKTEEAWSLKFRNDSIMPKMTIQHPSKRESMFSEGTEGRSSMSEPFNTLFPAFSSTNVSYSERGSRGPEEEKGKSEQQSSEIFKKRDSYGMSAEEKERIASTARRELNQERRRKCVRKIPRSRPSSIASKRQDTIHHFRKWMCTIS
ncbi:cGMP-specific 3 3' [Octopus vulgaris]|uniref:Phosphodiesterase n=1 Tax=Octopus vulgaris TaxID=6645 RepID=A0AA36BUS5_OCTVU|nr:cGMP-specific 3 3' [Octopus vulgaris]